MHYLKDGEIGDVKRMYIGGVGSLYRTARFSGQWEHGERNGVGLLTYTNGDTIHGNFLHGQPHGVHRYTFHSAAHKDKRGVLAARSRGARYDRGERVEWLDEKSPLMTLLSAFDR
jgi:hypothetical protein